MEQYIPKSALVAEIERRYKLVDKYETNEFCAVASRDEFIHLMNFIDTIEVKEVDFEKEYKDYINCDNGHTAFDIAEHFFDLGMRVSNSTKVAMPNIDDFLKENGVNPDSKEAKIIKESYFMAIEKLTQK